MNYLTIVRGELMKVTWATRKDTLITSGLVCSMAIVAAGFFFFLIDQCIGFGVRLLLGSGV